MSKFYSTTKTPKPITTKNKLTMRRSKDKDNQFNAKTNDLQKEKIILFILSSYYFVFVLFTLSFKIIIKNILVFNFIERLIIINY